MKVKELHLYVDDPRECVTTHKETEYLIDNQTCNTIRTTQIQFLSFKYADRLFVHANNETHEITKGSCEGTRRKITAAHNIPKLLLAGEFDWYK